DHYRVQAEPTGAWRPLGRGLVSPQRWQLRPGRARVLRLEESGVLDARIHGVGVMERGLEVPDALELIWMRRAVVPLVRPDIAVVSELIAHGLPGLAAVAGAMHHLSEPAARLRCVKALRVDRRAFEVIDLPTREQRALHGP